MTTQREPTSTGDGQPSFRRRLGRGLGALLGGTRPAPEPPPEHAPPSEHAATPLADAAGESTDADGARREPTDRSEIHVDLIGRNPFQPRRDFDPETLAELAESIRRHGVLQPLLVRPLPPGSEGDGEYQLIAGERRLLAARQAGLETVPCRVLALEDRRVCEAAIEENLKRKDLGVLEKARAFQDYLERFGTTIEELAKQLSMNRSTVSNFLRLLELAEPVKEALTAEQITAGHARALLSLEEADQIGLCERVVAESLSVRKTEEAVREVLKAREAGPSQVPDEAGGDKSPTTNTGADAPPPETIPFTPAGGAKGHMTSHVLSLQDQLRELLGLKVEIKLTGRDAGRVVIAFGSNDEFERIVGHLRRAA